MADPKNNGFGTFVIVVVCILFFSMHFMSKKTDTQRSIAEMNYKQTPAGSAEIQAKNRVREIEAQTELVKAQTEQETARNQQIIFIPRTSAIRNPYQQ